MRASVRFGPLLLCWIALLGIGFAAHAGTPLEPEELAARVRAAALLTYVHGMTDEIAERQVGQEGVPELLRLLADPAFPRRDNVVAILAHLRSGEATAPLVRFAERPVAGITSAEERRALLLVPRALGHIARDGDEAAVDTLLEITAAGAQGGPLAGAVAANSYDNGFRRRMVESALKGLAISRSRRALERLENVAGKKAPPILSGVDLAETASQALRVYAPPKNPASSGTAEADELAATSDRAVLGNDDTSDVAHLHGLTYATHVDLQGPTSFSIDNALLKATRTTATAELQDDVACCNGFVRQGVSQGFGNPGDGLDIIDDRIELGLVLGQFVARIKVVEEINYCSGPGTNIIGCSFLDGDSMIVVDTASNDMGILWLHEYGHNVGLGHVSDSQNIMHGFLALGQNRVLTQEQCNGFHAPSPGAAAIISVDGVCHDDDQDDTASNFDNCPDLANPDQDDGGDGDGVGDLCDNCPFTPATDQTDSDLDSLGDLCDNCALVANVDQADGDSDDLGDACDVCLDEPNDYDGDDLCSDADNCFLDANADQADTDSDGIGDTCDLCAGDSVNDVDEDGICAAADTCPQDYNPPAPEQVTLAAGLAERPRFSPADLNGDGRLDLVVASHQYRELPQAPEGALFAFLGSDAGYADQPDVVVRGPGAGCGLGLGMASGGDVNGDGYDDVVATVQSRCLDPTGPRRVFLYYGSPDGLVRTPVVLDPIGTPWVLRMPGDLNGDGYDDVAIGNSQYDSFGAVFIYYGSAQGLPTSASRILVGEQRNASFGRGLSGAGDVNGDGYDDLIVGATSFEYAGSRRGELYLYTGGPSGLSDRPVSTVLGEQELAFFGNPLASAGDVNDDGYDDVLVGVTNYSLQGLNSDQGAVYLFDGSPDGISTDSPWLEIGEQSGASFGGVLSPAGDVNADGYDDFLIGAPFFENASVRDVGAAFLYLGSANGPANRAAWSVFGEAFQNAVGGSLASLGDLDEDGFDDFLVDDFLRAIGTDSFRMGIYHGSAAGVVGSQPDFDGDGTGDPCDTDRDADGVDDSTDNCPWVPNLGQQDTNADGVGDACDADGDGVDDISDNCPTIVNPGQEDFLFDGAGDACDDDDDGIRVAEDNCPTDANRFQHDADGDGVGDVCDADADDDGLDDVDDNCPLTANVDQADIDGDDVGDVCDDDTDGDSTLTVIDNCPAVANPDQTDIDGDLLGDLCDPCIDVDHDGFGNPSGTECPGGNTLDCDDSRDWVFPGAPDLCDSFDNDCDGTPNDDICSDYEVTGDGRIDGTELAWLGRAFGQCGVLLPLDYSSDGCVDGDDLAVLAAAWGCSGLDPICDGDD